MIAKELEVENLNVEEQAEVEEVIHWPKLPAVLKNSLIVSIESFCQEKVFGTIETKTFDEAVCPFV